MKQTARGNITDLGDIDAGQGHTMKPVRTGAGLAAGREDLPLIGREADLRALEDHLFAPGVASAIALIEGEAGLGKSRLLAELLARAAARGATGHRGACDEFERARAFGPLLDAFQISGDEVGSDAGVGDGGFLVIERMLSVIEGAGGGGVDVGFGPLVLAVEDLHWADDSTLRALRAFSKRLDQLPLVLVATYRPFPREPNVARVLDALIDDVALHVVLEPLSNEALVSLAREVVGAPVAQSLRGRLASTGGNPLYLIELVTALRADGAIELVDGRAEAVGASRPVGLYEAILRRVGHLPPDVLHLLHVASILGTSFVPTDLATVLGRSVGAILPLFDDAIRARVLVASDDRLSFRHDLIREAIYEDIPAPLRQALHLEAANALESAGAPRVVVARHVARGASPGDASVVESLRQAARTCVFDDPTTAIELLERARDLLPVGDPRRAGVMAELVLPFELVGRTAEVEACAEAVLAASPSKGTEYLVRRSLALSLLVRGRPMEAERQYEIVTAMEDVDAFRRSRVSDRAVDFANFAVCRTFQGNVAGAGEPAQAALELAEESGDGFARALAFAGAGFAAEVQGHVQEALSLHERGVEGALSSPAAHLGNLWPHIGLANALCDVDRYEEHERVILEGRRFAEQQGRASQVPVFDALLGGCKLYAGDWDDAVALLTAVVTATDEVGDRMRIVPFSLAALAFIAVHRGEIDEAEAWLARADEDLSRHGLGIGIDFIPAARAIVLEAKGDAREGVRELGVARELLGEARYYLAVWRLVCPELVRLAVAHGELEIARRTTEEAEEGARRAGGVASADAAALLCRGRLEGDADASLDAVEMCRRAPRPFDLASASGAAAVHLAKSGRAAEATPLIDESVEIFERLGAVWAAQRLGAELRAVGVRRGVRAPRVRAKSGWESLTETELRVVDLVAQGLTNKDVAGRLFVSRFTVETHVRHVFQKLGIRGRAQLAAMATKRDR